MAKIKESPQSRKFNRRNLIDPQDPSAFRTAGHGYLRSRPSSHRHEGRRRASTRAISGRGGSFPWGGSVSFSGRGHGREPAIANHAVERCNHHKSNASKSCPPHLGYGAVPAACPRYRSATLHPQYARHAPPHHQRTGGPLSRRLDLPASTIWHADALATPSPMTSPSSNRTEQHGSATADSRLPPRLHPRQHRRQHPSAGAQPSYVSTTPTSMARIRLPHRLP
jgi:hypothetical protein